MKYIDKPYVAAESYFPSVAFIMPREGGVSAEEAASRFASLNFFHQLKLMSQIRKGLINLSGDVNGAYGILPEELRSVSEERTEFNSNSLMTFFGWYEKVNTRNSGLHNAWKLAVNNCASSIGGEEGRLISSLAFNTNHRCSIVKNEKGILIKILGGYWGSCSLQMDGACVSDDTLLPVYGYISWLEIDRENDVYELRLVIDTEFTASSAKTSFDYEGYENLTIRCSNFSMDKKLVDYCSYFRNIGKNTEQTVRLCMETLTSKYKILGSNSLSTAERELLPLARLFLALNIFSPNGPIDEYTLVELLENRYQFKSCISILRNIAKKRGSFPVSDALENACNEYEGEQGRKTLTLLKWVKKYVYSMGRYGEFLYEENKLLDMLQESLSVCSSEWKNNESINSAGFIISNAAKQVLENNNFKSDFPNFYRHRERYTEFISIVCKNAEFPPKLGEVNLNYKIEFARCTTKELVRNRLDPNGLSARDVGRLERSEFGSVADEDDLINIMFTDNRAFPECTYDNSAFFDAVVNSFDMCERYLKTNKLPRQYKKLRKSVLLKNGSLRKTIFSVCKYFTFVPIPALLIFFNLTPSMSTQERIITALIAVLLSLLSGIITSLIVWINKVRSPWKSVDAR